MKDPAVLIYFDKWISSTNGMKADFRAWYFDLLIHQYDKGFVPIDIDELAGICRVRPSEYQMFNQMVEQVVKQKFSVVDGFYRNTVVDEVLRKREIFKDKREKSGNIGVVIKLAKSLNIANEAQLDRLKNYLYSLEVEKISEFKNKQVVEHLLNLYINEDVNEDYNTGKGKGGMGEKPLGEIPTWIEFLTYGLEKEPSVDHAALKNKYDAWVENGWKDGNNDKIKNWKSKLLHTMPYIKKNITEAEQMIGRTSVSTIKNSFDNLSR